MLWPVSIKGVILNASGVLLLKNERDEWELPGGRLEAGEEPEDCLGREILEETNLSVAIADLLDCWRYPVLPGKDVLIVAYGCRLVGAGDPLRISHEHADAAWVELKQLNLYNMPDKYRQSIMSWGGMTGEKSGTAF